MALASIPSMPLLRDERVLVRPWELSDTDTVLDAATDGYITTITTVPTDIDEAGAKAFIERQISRPQTDMAHALAICDPVGGEAVGHLFASFLRQGVGRVTMGYWVAPSFRRNRFAGAALDLVSRTVLEAMSLSRVTLYIEPWNTASIRTALSAGFSEDGMLRGWETYADGVPRNVLAFGRLAADV